MCAEVRGAGVLAFIDRGPRTLIGPAFGRTHEAAGCEFCGACVSVCPTGALADKVSKWDGAPDGIAVSTCPLCALGCQVELAHAGGRLSSVHGARDPQLNDGQLCLRGRFCLPETTQHPSRARRPRLRKGRYDRVVGWDEALAEVSARLAAARPADVLVLVAGDLTNEAVFAAQRLAREGLSACVDSTVRADLPGGPEALVAALRPARVARGRGHLRRRRRRGPRRALLVLRGRRPGAPRPAPGGAAGDGRRSRDDPVAGGRPRPAPATRRRGDDAHPPLADGPPAGLAPAGGHPRRRPRRGGRRAAASTGSGDRARTARLRLRRRRRAPAGARAPGAALRRHDRAADARRQRARRARARGAGRHAAGPPLGTGRPAPAVRPRRPPGRPAGPPSSISSARHRSPNARPATT